MYGPSQGSRTLPWANSQIFLEAFFICNTINKNLNKNFQTKTKNGPRQGTFLYHSIYNNLCLRNRLFKKLDVILKVLDIFEMYVWIYEIYFNYILARNSHTHLTARDIKSKLGQIDRRPILIASYEVEICIFIYEKILVYTWTIQTQDPIIKSIKCYFVL